MGAFGDSRGFLDLWILISHLWVLEGGEGKRESGGKSKAAGKKNWWVDHFFPWDFEILWKKGGVLWVFLWGKISCLSICRKIRSFFCENVNCANMPRVEMSENSILHNVDSSFPYCGAGDFDFLRDFRVLGVVFFWFFFLANIIFLWSKKKKKRTRKN